MLASGEIWDSKPSTTEDGGVSQSKMGLLSVTDKIDLFWCWFVFAAIVSFSLTLVPLFYKKSGVIQSDRHGLLTSTKYTSNGIKMRKRFGAVSIGIGSMSVLIGLLCGLNIFVSLVLGTSLAIAALPNLLYGSLKEAYSDNDGLRISDFCCETFVPFDDIKRVYIYSPKGQPGEIVFIKLKKQSSFGKTISLVPSQMSRFYQLLQKHGIELGGYKYNEVYYRTHSDW